MIEFRGWPKIARLFREVTITEKIDGTNAAIGIQEFMFGEHVGGIDENGVSHDVPENATLVMGPLNGDDGLPVFEYLIYAQSRSRIIAPGKADNHGFAGWVHDNATALVDVLGPGLHFGEYWGSGINRGYGLPKGERRFSLFNTSRWTPENLHLSPDKPTVEGLSVVPILYQGEFSTLAVKSVMEQLRLGGSAAAPQFMRPEGVVIFHTAANTMFKSTLEDDEMPKAVATKKPRELKNVELVSVTLGGSPYEPSEYTTRLPLELAA